MDDSLVPTLRGGGASGRRKEARKQQFKHDELESARFLQAGTLKAESKAIQPSMKLPRQDEHHPELHLKQTSPTASEQMGLDLSEKRELAEKCTSRKPQRFIVFIGNLPFTTTVDSITCHFRKVKPISIRHSTVKDTAKSKGFAFLEFDKYDRMKTCLKLYHHSSFDDGVSPPRQINVELTAGGGGRSQARRTKLHAKNKKLNEERKRRAHDGKGAGREMSPERLKKSSENIHPSRRSRVANTQN